MGDYTVLIISSILINNIVLAQYLGICPFIGTSKKMETATGMAGAVVFVMTLAAIITWTIDTYFLKTLDIEFLRTISFILVIASPVHWS
jgi:electron transport complex protein RnfA